MFESLKNKEKSLCQNELNSLAEYNKPSFIIGVVTTLIKLFSCLVPIGLLIFPGMLFGQCGWAMIVIYICGLPLTILGIRFVYKTTYKLSIKSFEIFVKTDSFDIKLLILGIFSIIVLYLLTDFWVFIHLYNL